MQESNESIYLVGLMGSGKTTVAKLLAKRSGMQFVDSDHEVEARNGVNIPTIFEIEGEEGFRRRESQVIQDLVSKPGIVLATGGGAVLRPENRAALRSNGWVVYLNVPPTDLYERTRHDKGRPLLQTEDPLAKLRELYAYRDPLYREVAHMVVDGGRMGAATIVNLILREYEKVCGH